MDILSKTNIQNKILRAPEFGEETSVGGASSTPSNAVFIGGVEVDKFYLGNSADVKIFLGDVKLYPRDISYKLVAQYSDTTEYKVVCNGDTTLSSSEVSGHTTPMSAMTSAVVSDCVTELGLNAFSGASSITSLTLSDGITRFSNQAFMHTSSLTDFTFPSSLTYLAGSTFRYSGIRKFNNRIPSGVTALPSGCFADMYSLSAITIPSRIVSGSTNVFLRDRGLTEVHFERTTPPALGADAFRGCTALIKIYIPSCDCYDAYAADSQFSGLTNLIYGEDNTQCNPPMNFRMKRYFIDGRSDEFACDSSSAVTSADTRSGYTVAQLTASTSGLSKVEIGNCVTSISSYTFSAMTQLSSITLSNSVKTIANNGCMISDSSSEANRLHDISLGKVETIGNRAFRYCGRTYGTNQPKIKFPNTLTSIGEYAFQMGKYNELTFENGGNLTIGNYAFSGCSSYSGISISTNSIKRLSGETFNRFSGLTSVSLSGVTYLESNIAHQFSNCHQLTDFELIGDGTIFIPQYFINGNSLTAITLGGISEISNSYGLNQGNNQASVRKLTMLDTTPPTINTTSISAYNPTVIYVPSSAVNTYKTATVWKNYASIIQAKS